MNGHLLTMLHDIATRSGLPEDMQTLLRTLPRDGWPGHPNFAQSIQNWMGAHQMFRQLGRIVTEDTQTFLNGGLEDSDYTGRLAHFGTLLVRNLHGHHTWEDRSFFPELEKADPRFETGLDMLEKDHETLDALLDRFTRRANRVVQLQRLEPAQMPEEARPMQDDAAEIERFLERHLTDEEDLVVPIILHHKLRG